MSTPDKTDLSNAQWQLPGGIMPKEHKVQSLTGPIQTAPLPSKLIIPVSQPGFKTAEINVSIGDYVFKGQPITRDKDGHGLICHASSSGTVTHIEPRAIPNASNLPEMCVVIATDGKEQWFEKPEQNVSKLNADYHSLKAEQLFTLIAEAGISGLGGAGFPTHLKLHGAQQIHTLIINACECEPFITADDALIQERSDDIIAGIKILLHILQPQRCLIGIEDNKASAKQALLQAIRSKDDDQNIEMLVLPSKYPSGSEKQLIQILTGVEIPSGSLAIHSGILCQNIATVYAIARAVIQGEPLISRITTLTGAALKFPGNKEVLIGTPISTLLKACEIETNTLSELIMGGPLMGIRLPSQELPVMKISNCIIATTLTELPAPPPAQACIRCGLCAEACPISLLPQQLYWFARSKEHEKAQSHNLFDCIECGACAYVCPSHIPLVQYYRSAKASIRTEKTKHAKAEQSRERFEFHLLRVEREKAEADKRRQARAKLAKQKAAKSDNKAKDSIQAALARVKAKKAREANK